MASEDPKPKSYRPFVAARRPRSKAEVKPEWRILVHRKHVKTWNNIPDVCGESNAGELWLHLATQPDKPPRLGTVTPMKGRQYGETDEGLSRVYHYELSGAGRVDYRYCRTFVSEKGDEHAIVQIISIDLTSH